jgi:ABC-2 type transport system permease protein
VEALGISVALWTATVKSALQYRANFVLGVVFGLIYQCTGFVFIWVVLSRFEAVGGWSLGEVAFLYGLRLVMHALNGFFSGGLFEVEWRVRQGEYDRYLVRPLAPLLQILTQHAPNSALGDLLGGVALFVAATTLVAVSWTPAAILYLVLAVIGGALIEFAIRMFCASLAFRFLSAQPALSLVDEILSNFGNYPLTIFGGVLQFLLTFGLPLAFMAYFPAVVLLGRGAELQVHPLFAYTTPLFGAIWLALAVAVFRREQRFYKSAGH